MSAPAIDLLRRAHASLEEAIRRMDAFETDSARDDGAAATVSEYLRSAIDEVAAIAGRVLMRTPVEPPRLSAECADEGEADDPHRQCSADGCDEHASIHLTDGWWCRDCSLEAQKRPAEPDVEAAHLANCEACASVLREDAEAKPADLEDVEARTEALLPPAEVHPTCICIPQSTLVATACPAHGHNRVVGGAR